MPHRGEVWLVDLGLAQKIRPALILSTAYSDTDRALITVISHDKDSWLEIRAAGLRGVSQARCICCAKRHHDSGEACLAATRRTLS
jgi:mRNA-degrading endonuclease toxin of MazEF toxin-antitoxin module